MKHVISLDSKFQIQGDVLSTTLQDGAVILELQRGTYFGLNAVGQCVWNLMKKKSDLRTIEREINNTFEVSSESVHSDILSFVKALLSHGLIQQVSP